MAIKKRGKSWQVDCTLNGIRYRKSFKSLEEASSSLKELSEGEYTTLTISKYLNLHAASLWPQDSTHFRNVLSNISEVVSLIGDIPMSLYRDMHTSIIINRYIKNGNSSGTINRKLSSLSKLFRHAHKSRQIKWTPYFPRQRESKGRLRFLTKEEQEDLFEEIRKTNEGEYSLCVFLVNTGARLGEAINLRWEDINWNASSCTFWETKGGSSRTVYLTAKASEALINQRQFIRTHTPFGRINTAAFRGHWHKAKQRVGLGDDKDVVPHVLRHTCASRLVQGGVDMKRVQEWLGHKSMAMTMRYAHLSPKDLLSCVNVLDKE